MDDIFGVTEIAKQVGDTEAAHPPQLADTTHEKSALGVPQVRETTADAAAHATSEEDRKREEKVGFDRVEHAENKI